MTLGRTCLIRDNNKPAALLCFDHTFRDFSGKIGITDSDVQILTRTNALYEYAELFKEFIDIREPWAERSVQRLFSFTVQSGRVCLSRGTFLHGLVGSSQRSQSLDEDTMMEVRSFFDLYERTLRRRLVGKIEAYCHSCLSVHVFDPCDAAFWGRCDRTECHRQHNLNHTWFDNRLHFHMSILNLLQFTGVGLEHYLRRFDLLLSICCLRC